MIRRLARYRWFSELGRRMVPADRVVLRFTGGRVGLSGLLGLPSLVLITTGRRTGRERRTPVLYVADADRYVVAGSNWGGERHPAWSANLLSEPRAGVLIGTRRVPVRAEPVTGAERDRLWERFVAVWPAYADYAERAPREIRLFALNPEVRC